jgi:hypothetical protein
MQRSDEMGSSWERLLENFHSVRMGEYRNDPERREALIEAMAYTIQTILEKLRDADTDQ